ncbi:unnamed protein product [Peronospora farinosa]|uniref:VASt domain-containing protein n=1 Tax=Peronospora farinosa TaxID=134698 RepID=A0AAV0U5R5_9STRA|nr:unnamed protein product [Peronospora farinosa]
MIVYVLLLLIHLFILLLLSSALKKDVKDLTVEPSLDSLTKNKMQSSNAMTMSKNSPARVNDISMIDNRDISVTSSHVIPIESTYPNDLSRAFPRVCQKAKSGVQLCHAVAVFVTERAGLESNYAQAQLKLAQSAEAEDWSEHCTQCWKTFREALEHLAQERWAFASTMQTSIVPGAKTFAAQQEIQVQRLITEGTKMRWAQQQMSSSLDKAKAKYDCKCQEAIDMIATVRKSDNMSSTDTNSLSSDSSPGEVSLSKELTDKLAAGAGQLLTKMWDTTYAFGRNPLERQRSKLCGCFEGVIAAEKYYLQTVQYTNAQRLIFVRKINENLHALQLTEEQRLEYLRDILMRMQKAFIDMLSRSQQFVEQMKTSANEFDEMADIEKGFQSLGSQEEVDVNRADLSINPFYLHMTHIQAKSDDGQRMIETINSVVVELIASENRFLQSLHRLLRTHENGGLSPTTDLFGASSSNTHMNFLADEGATMTNGWIAVKDQTNLLLEVHQEFQSLLAEPVSLILDTMKREYESVRVSTQENFLKLHSTLCNETAAHKRLQQKLDATSRDSAIGYSHLPGSPPVKANSHDIEVTQALKMLSTNTGFFNEKERRSETKLRQLAEKNRLLQTQLAKSTSFLQQTYQAYVQESEAFISTYMENERYRLQAGKNSLQSLAKAIEHMLRSGTSVGNKALVEFEKIDPSEDIAEFIRMNRQPIKRVKHIVANYHDNDILKVAIREYLVSLDASSSTASENADKFLRSPTSGMYSPIFRNDALREKKLSRASTLLADDEHAILTKKDNAGGSVSSEDESANSGTEQDDKLVEAQPLEDSDFQRQFKLDSPEQVVESFSCALFLSNFPFHGRLYLTRNRMCFSGWRDTIFVALFSEITAMGKKNTALIVPNAIEITVKGEKVFFTSFIFRDECFHSIQQLRSIKKKAATLLSDTTKQPYTESLDADSEFVTGNESRRQRRCNDVVAVAPSRKRSSLPDVKNIDYKFIDIADETATEDRRDPSLHLSDSMTSKAPLVIPDKDILLDEYDLLVDEEVALSVDTAFLTLWIESDTLFRNLLVAAGSTGISLPPWKKKAVVYTAVNKPDTFDASRLVSYTHNKKYMIGPSVIPTSQTQRYAYTPGSRLIVSTTTCVSDVPYCDYFRVEQRWVFSATQKSGVSLAQVGLRVQWLKNTWLKKQIESAAISEAKDAVKA